MPVPTDTVLAQRYRLGPLLGRGGMAEVYEAVDERLGRPVAVKLLRPEFAAEPRMRDRFEAEARSAARLSHPNVVSVFDSGEDGLTPFIVMERLPGETLADRMAEGPLGADWLRAMAADVLGALESAHAAGVVHRDVKPANILLTAEGRTKVADFGIAKTIEEAPSDLTGANQVLGTPAYLAPERIDGRPASVRSDVYAFGVVLYEALAGVKPFTGATPLDMALAVRRAEPPPLAQLRPGLDGELVAAVERAMDRDPERRFESAAKMAAALQEAFAGTQVADPFPTVAMVGSSGAATIVMPMPHAVADDPPVGPLPPARRAGGLLVKLGRRRLLWLALLLLGLIVAALVLLATRGDDVGRSPGAGVAPTTVPLQAPTSVAPPTTAAPATVPPASGEGKHGKGRGKG